ncbi:MAG: hypothetical protein AB1659_13380 [Thermodesulfobacteriota bacterium]
METGLFPNGNRLSIQPLQIIMQDFPFLSDPLIALERIYRFFDAHTSELKPICSKGCASCCTGNVTMTSLEGRFLLKTLPRDRRRALISILRSKSHEPRFHPNITVNRMAKLYSEGREVDDPEPDPDPERCPLLKNGICMAYEGRPMMCRSMISKTPCSENGYAEMDPYSFTTGTVCLQLIEHIDTSGFFGNLTDVLLELLGEETLRRKLISTHPLRILMVPPEHQEKLLPAVEALQSEIRSQGTGQMPS